MSRLFLKVFQLFSKKNPDLIFSSDREKFHL